MMLLKKLVFLSLILSVGFSVSGCGNKESKESTTPDTSSDSSSDQIPTESESTTVPDEQENSVQTLKEAIDKTSNLTSRNIVLKGNSTRSKPGNKDIVKSEEEEILFKNINNGFEASIYSKNPDKLIAYSKDGYIYYEDKSKEKSDELQEIISENLVPYIFDNEQLDLIKNFSVEDGNDSSKVFSLFPEDNDKLNFASVVCEYRFGIKIKDTVEVTQSEYKITVDKNGYIKNTAIKLSLKLEKDIEEKISLDITNNNPGEEITINFPEDLSSYQDTPSYEDYEDTEE